MKGRLLFSERMGLVKPNLEIQLDYIDAKLKTRLWNLIYETFFKHIVVASRFSKLPETEFYEHIWTNFFHNLIDEFPASIEFYKNYIKKYFFESNYFQCYDFIEFAFSEASEFYDDPRYQDDLNVELELGLSGYRMVGGFLTPITSQIELDSISYALDYTFSLEGEAVSMHISKAIELFSNRESPDYENSIKESISAVESYVYLISGSNGDFSKSLKKLLGSTNVHSALIDSIIKLYGFSSDAEGVRHGGKGGPAVSGSEARYMLITCSAIINFIADTVNRNQDSKA
jgi:hypothetical protein